MNRAAALTHYSHIAAILTVGQDTLFHGETLFIVSTSNAENVSLPFVTEMIGLDLSAHSLLVEHTEFQVIDDLEQFLCTRSRIRYVQLKLCRKI